MRINTVPVEAYRQVTNQGAENQKASQEKFDLEKTLAGDRITLPGMTEAEVAGIRAQKSPSLLQGVLTPEEKSTLVKYFARLGDAEESTHLYDPGARAQRSAVTGAKLDVRG